MLPVDDTPLAIAGMLAPRDCGRPDDCIGDAAAGVNVAGPLDARTT
jgi:hypothetical protein